MKINTIDKEKFEAEKSSRTWGKFSNENKTVLELLDSMQIGECKVLYFTDEEEPLAASIMKTIREFASGRAYHSREKKYSVQMFSKVEKNGKKTTGKYVYIKKINKED